MDVATLEVGAPVGDGEAPLESTDDIEQSASNSVESTEAVSEQAQTVADAPNGGGAPGANGAAANGANYSAGVRHPDYANRAARTRTGERPSTAARNGARNGAASKSKTSAKSKTRTFKPKTQEELRKEQLLNLARVALCVVVVLGAAFYMLSASGVLSSEVAPQDALAAVNGIKNSQSTQDGFTVDQVLSQWVKDAKSTGDLVRYQGWTTKLIPGESSRVIVSFFYETKKGKQSAEWVANLSKHTYSPQTDLARQVFPGEASH